MSDKKTSIKKRKESIKSVDDPTKGFFVDGYPFHIEELERMRDITNFNMNKKPTMKYEVSWNKYELVLGTSAMITHAFLVF